jgi:hypothetical protein
MDAPILDSILSRQWNNLGDFEEPGVAKAEQEADARIIRQPLERRRVAKLNLEVVREYRLIVIPGAREEKLANGALRNQS